MLEHLKTERQSGGGAQARLRAYMIGLVILGGLILLWAKSGDEPGPERLPEAKPDPKRLEAEAPRIDLERLPQEDSSTVRARYQEEALDYLLGIANRDFEPLAARLPLDELAALPFEEARGKVFETVGTVETLVRSRYGGEGKDQRLWSVLVESESGRRVIVLKHGLKSDFEEGRPRDAYAFATEYLARGDRILLRGIYLQRWAGTLDTAIVREPIPVLVAAPPNAAFRILPERLVDIEDPAEADWDDVEDRYLNETQEWAEPALFQVVRWARTQGYEKVSEMIRTGKLEARPWDIDLFNAWGEEVETTEPDAPRPVTDSLRGGFFETTGLVASFLRVGWRKVPRLGSAWDVDQLYLFDLMSDHWANRALRTWSVWPLETYPGMEGKGQHVRIYGFFLKNHTYETNQVRGSGPAQLTMPMFVVVHVEPVPEYASPYRTMIWVVSGIILLIFVVFYVVFVRGEKREAERMDAYRRKLRKRIRDHDAGKKAESAEGGDAPS